MLSVVIRKRKWNIPDSLSSVPEPSPVLTEPSPQDLVIDFCFRQFIILRQQSSETEQVECHTARRYDAEVTNKISGPKKLAQSLRVFAVLAETGVWFPAPMSGSWHVSVTPTPGDLMLSSCLHVYNPTFRQIYIHIIKNKIVIKIKMKVPLSLIS